MSRSRRGSTGNDPEVARRRLALLATELGSDGDRAPAWPAVDRAGGNGADGRGPDGAGANVGQAAAGPAPARVDADLTTTVQATDQAADQAADQAVDPAAGGPGRHRAPALPAPARVGGAFADQLPTPLRRVGAQRAVSGQHVTVVALLVAVLVSGGAWWVLSARPEQRPLAPVVQPPPASAAPDADSPAGPLTPTASVPYPAATGGPATPGAAVDVGSVVVDVAGRVRRPGLVALPAGSRVADALERAGGARPGVDLTTLNLARPLVDGEQLLVGVQAAAPPAVVAPPSPTSATSTAPAALVDLNTATMEQLETLPGVGPVTAQAILDWRAANGAFTTVEELIEVDGIGDATLADLRDLVTV